MSNLDWDRQIKLEQDRAYQISLEKDKLKSKQKELEKKRELEEKRELDEKREVEEKELEILTIYELRKKRLEKLDKK